MDNGSSYDPSGGLGLLAGFGVFLWIAALVVVALEVYVAVRIVRKAGYSGWWVALAFIPMIGGLLAILLFAFSTWPIEQELARVRTMSAMGRPGGPRQVPPSMYPGAGASYGPPPAPPAPGGPPAYGA